MAQVAPQAPELTSLSLGLFPWRASPSPFWYCKFQAQVLQSRMQDLSGLYSESVAFGSYYSIQGFILIGKKMDFNLIFQYHNLKKLFRWKHLALYVGMVGSIDIS